VNRSFVFGVVVGVAGLWAWHQFKPMGSMRGSAS
jgi:hypothetical protein